MRRGECAGYDMGGGRQSVAIEKTGRTKSQTATDKNVFVYIY